MFAGSQQQLFASYNQWMNEKLYGAAEQLSDEQRKQDLHAFFKSIHGTFEHLLWVDQAWLKRFAGEPVTPAAPGFSYPDYRELWAARRACDQRIVDWACALGSDWLEQPFSWRAVLYPRTFTLPGFVVAAQFFNHQTHHRGQVTTLLMQLGIDPGVTDIPMLPVLQDLPAV